MKKILTITSILVITLMLSILPALAAETVERKTTKGNFVTVSDITNGDTIHADSSEPSVNIKITQGEDNKDTVEVTYYAASLRVVEEELEGRPAGYAWLGVRLVPNNNDNTYSSVKFEDGTSDKLTNSSDSKKCEDYYVGVSKEKLEKAVKEGKDLVYTDTLTWLKDDNTEENAPVTNLKIIIKAADMVVYDKEDQNVEWDEETYNTAVAEYEAAKKAEAQKDKTPKTGI